MFDKVATLNGHSTYQICSDKGPPNGGFLPSNEGSAAVPNVVESGVLIEQDSDFFEGSEKLLEVWFYFSDDSPPSNFSSVKSGRSKSLRNIPRVELDKLLDYVNAKIISTISSEHWDAYVLSESSLFVSDNKIILKTCGTTTLLLGLEYLIELALNYGEAAGVKDLYYSRKSFLRPEHQKFPHTNFDSENEFLKSMFPNGQKMNFNMKMGDEWFVFVYEAGLSGISDDHKKFLINDNTAISCINGDRSPKIIDNIIESENLNNKFIDSQNINNNISMKTKDNDNLFLEGENNFLTEECNICPINSIISFDRQLDPYFDAEHSKILNSKIKIENCDDSLDFLPNRSLDRKDRIFYQNSNSAVSNNSLKTNLRSNRHESCDNISELASNPNLILTEALDFSKNDLKTSEFGADNDFETLHYSDNILSNKKHSSYLESMKYDTVKTLVKNNTNYFNSTDFNKSNSCLYNVEHNSFSEINFININSDENTNSPSSDILTFDSPLNTTTNDIYTSRVTNSVDMGSLSKILDNKVVNSDDTCLIPDIYFNNDVTSDNIKFTDTNKFLNKNYECLNKNIYSENINSLNISSFENDLLNSGNFDSLNPDTFENQIENFEIDNTLLVNFPEKSDCNEDINNYCLEDSKNHLLIFKNGQNQSTDYTYKNTPDRYFNVVGNSNTFMTDIHNDIDTLDKHSYNLNAFDQSDISPMNEPDSSGFMEDYTIELLMNKLNPLQSSLFYKSPGYLGSNMTKQTGINELMVDATYDSMEFDPCGYSMNSLLDDKYQTIHVTPQDSFSYASYETNQIPDDSIKSCYKAITQTFYPESFLLTAFLTNNDEKLYDFENMLSGLYNKVAHEFKKLNRHTIHCLQFIKA